MLPRRVKHPNWTRQIKLGSGRIVTVLYEEIHRIPHEPDRLPSGHLRFYPPGLSDNELEEIHTALARDPIFRHHAER